MSKFKNYTFSPPPPLYLHCGRQPHQQRSHPLHRPPSGGFVFLRGIPRLLEVSILMGVAKWAQLGAHIYCCKGILHKNHVPLFRFEAFPGILLPFSHR